MSRRAGYSLLEVLIAFAVMTMVLMVLLPGQARLLSRVQRVDDRALAQDLALSRLAALGLSEPLIAGTSTTTESPWQIDSTVEPATLPGVEAALVRVTVTVRAGNGPDLATVSAIRPAP